VTGYIIQEQMQIETQGCSWVTQV